MLLPGAGLRPDPPTKVSCIAEATDVYGVFEIGSH
jgi:hypothetical protein